ncbi:MAG: QueT transporter family protein [Lachnospiraceae bacterium]|jgi:uncharacterized membrane protein|nr:QueT transporter family protein [Lachnospiraceae bacterium]
MKDRKILFLVQAAMIAAIYVVLTALAAGFDLASGMIQVRFSEALTILPFFTTAAVPGLTIGCLIANLVTGGSIYDIIFGTLATLLGAAGTYLLRKHRYLCSLPPIASNAIIIPFVLTYGYGVPGGIPLQMATVGAGEAICCLFFGQILITALLPIRTQVFDPQ